jgi:small subunit ribosomal protein S14
MKYQLAKDKSKRKMAQRDEIKRLGLKYMIRSSQMPFKRWFLNIFLAKLPRNGSQVRVRNRCTLTGRAKGVQRVFKMSRIALRELGSMGLINGLRKSSW